MNKHIPAGVRAAGIWKRLKHTVASWDQRGAAWAKNHNIPVWISRVPLVMFILFSLIGLTAGGLAVASVVAFIWAIAFMLQNIGNRAPYKSSDLNNTDDIFTPYDPEPYTFEEYEHRNQ